MEFSPLQISDILQIRPTSFEDNRGAFFEVYQTRKFAEAGIAQAFVQENQSRSRRGVLRGLHYQIRQPQGKLVRVLEWARPQRVMRVVSDQVGNPTWGRTLAQVTALALAPGIQDIEPWIGERAGVYHLADRNHASRLEWAKAILELDPRPEEQIVERVEAASTSDFPNAVKRPALSALDSTRFIDVFGFELPVWREALQLAIHINEEALA